MGVQVYFILSKNCNLIKIGSSGDPSRRIYDLSTSCPDDLTCLGLMSNSGGQEVKLHEQFKKDRVKGEWFRATPELLTFIEKNCAKPMAKVSYEITSKISRRDARKLEKIKFEAEKDLAKADLKKAIDEWYDEGLKKLEAIHKRIPHNFNTNLLYLKALEASKRVKELEKRYGKGHVKNVLEVAVLQKDREEDIKRKFEEGHRSQMLECGLAEEKIEVENFEKRKLDRERNEAEAFVGRQFVEAYKGQYYPCVENAVRIKDELGDKPFTFENLIFCYVKLRNSGRMIKKDEPRVLSELEESIVCSQTGDT